jgi:hypothetical protein
MPNTYYIDYILGSNSNSGADWGNAWKDINGAIAATIVPGDVCRIAKSPAPYSIGNATWTNLSKTVTLATAQTINIDLCETSWTPVNATSSDRLAVATDAKQGSYCVKIVEDATPANGEVQAYFATGALDLSTKQDVSFWIKNEVAITAGMLVLNLYTTADASGAAAHSFAIPAIPSTGRWLPLTISSGGNLSNNINSVAIANGAAATYTASKYIYIDNILACATGGLNLQSLISTNSAEQGGTEGWYGIQSINDTAVLLDTDTNTKSNAGEGYSGTGGAGLATYARETIKTTLAASGTTTVQDVLDSGTSGSNIEFQGGYDTGTGFQTGETYFDGLNGNGYGIRLNSKSFITLNYLNFSRYNYGAYFTNSINNTITTLSNANNNNYGAYFTNSSSNNTITTLSNANNNSYGAYFNSSSNNTITTLSNANNNTSSGVYFSSSSNNNIITTLSNANNNTSYGVYFTSSSNNTITTLSTTGNTTSAIYNIYGKNYIRNATIAEATIGSGMENYGNSRLNINKLTSTGYTYIYTDYGLITQQAATGGGTGNEWKLAVTNVARTSSYPLNLVIAKAQVNSGALVTVTCYFKKSHASDIGAALAVRAGQLSGVAPSPTVCPADTNRNQLTITFTPAEAGVIEIEGWAYWQANAADEYVLIDDIEITQA